MSGQLMLHCGGEQASFEQICAVELPEQTTSYTPVPHGDAIRLISDRLDKEYPGVDVEWEYGLNKGGAQLFAVATMQMDQQDFGMSIACRNSYDKSLSFGFAAGAQVFCCDNLALSGSAVTLSRKHTTNAWKDIRSMIFTAMIDSQDHYDKMRLDLNRMKEVGVSEDRGFEIIGRALGHRVLTSNQAGVAMKEWVNPSHEEFEERNLFSLYNSFTEAGKHGRAQLFMDRYTGFHDFFTPGGRVIEADYTETF